MAAASGVVAVPGTLRAGFGFSGTHGTGQPHRGAKGRGRRSCKGPKTLPRVRFRGFGFAGRDGATDLCGRSLHHTAHRQTLPRDSGTAALAARDGRAGFAPPASAETGRRTAGSSPIGPILHRERAQRKGANTAASYSPEPFALIRPGYRTSAAGGTPLNPRPRRSGTHPKRRLNPATRPRPVRTIRPKGGVTNGKPDIFFGSMLNKALRTVRSA